MGTNNGDRQLLRSLVRFYFVCGHCNTKWFDNRPESSCQRCGSRCCSHEQFVPPWLRSPLSTTSEADSSINSLSALLLKLPERCRGELFRAVLQGLADESHLSGARLLKAAFSAHWQETFGEVPSVNQIAEALSNPLPVKLVMAFNCLGYALSEDDMSAAVQSLIELLAAKVATFVAPVQRTLFNCEATVDKPTKTLPTTGRTTVDDLRHLILEGRKFPTVYADPPWPYENEASRAAAVNHYPVMSLKSICDQPVSKLVNDNAHLHLWTTNGFLREAFEVINAWGFEFKSCMVWIKHELGMGNYWRVSHEFLLLGVRGQLTFQDRTLPSWIQAHRTLHSRKPGLVRELIEKVSPGPYLELYGREELPNSAWTVYGNQVERRAF